MMEGMFARVTVYPTEARTLRRAPEPAFLGLPAPEQPLQVSRAEALVDFTPDASQPCEIKINGEVTVPKAFAIQKNPVKVELCGRSVTFKPGRNGTDENAEGSFRAENFSKNSSEYGVVYGGRLKFSITLFGKIWEDELIAAGLKTNFVGVSEIAAALTLEIGGEKYDALIRINSAIR